MHRLFGFIRQYLSPDGDQGGGQPAGQQNQQGQQSQPAGQQPSIDYAKIQQMLDGALSAREDTALKAYFKQQGLSQEEADQAIAASKQQKAANQPDVAGMQAQLEQLQSAARKAQVETEATLAAAGLGLDAKAIPYVLRMADFSQAAGQDGKVDSEAVKTAINKVLEDVPALKPQTAGGTGFIQVGAGGGKDQASEVNTQLDRIFGVQKK